MQARFVILVCLVVAGAAGVASAQSLTTGAIEGRVTDKAGGEPLVGVTIIATGATPEPQSALSEEDGHYKITDLLPGDYTVMFYLDDSIISRKGIHVGANDVVTVNQKMALAAGLVVDVEGHRSPIRVDDTTKGHRFDRKFIEKVPTPSRDIAGAAGTEPGAHNDGVGIAFSGSTGLENRWLVDGIDITGLTFGAQGSPILSEFVEEEEVIAGGYSAEWGRAIGGIINVITKTGSNKFKGSVFGTIQPSILTRKAISTPINASSIDVTSDRVYDADFGFDLGGPIIKDKLFFYVGFAPQLSRTDYTRITKRESDCRTLQPNGQLSACDPRLQSMGGHADGAADIDPKTGFYITDELDREIRSGTTQQYTALGKLNLAVTPKDQAQLSLIATPSKSESPGLFGLPSSGSRQSGLTTDGALHWTSKLNDDKTEIGATLAWHRSTNNTGSLDPALDNEPRQVLQDGDLGVWTALGGESAKTAEGCKATPAGGSDPYPYITNCPMLAPMSYAIGGPGSIAHDKEDRRIARLDVTQRAHFFGGHEIKAGLDFEEDQKEASRLYSGGAFIQNSVGNQVKVTRWVQLAPPGSADPRFDQICHTPDPDGGSNGGTSSSVAFACDYLGGTVGSPGTQIAGDTVNWAAYLRDSWRIRNGLVLNAGARYEEQRLRYAETLRGTIDPLTGNKIGTDAMNLTGNIAPRLGLIWDPTEEGQSKIYASWGRFFEAIPMDINDRSFGGEVSYVQTFNAASGACGANDPKLGGPNGTGCLTPSKAPDAEELLGSSGVLVAPGIKAQYMDEILIGAEYQLAPDLTIGVSYQNRRLGRVIEDVSTDGANTYIIANPGEWSEAEEHKLEERIARTDDPLSRTRLQHQLDLYKGIRVFDKPSRTYNAIEISLAHQFSRGLMIQASYTHSRTDGNYPGSVSYDNGQIDPNISSQYDLIELLANRQGRLPQDRPHSLKVDGYYTFDLGKVQNLTIGGRVRMVSGIPLNALGAHYLYGPDESFLLPRGELGRGELEHGIDLHLAYARKIGHGMTAEVFADIFNVYNRQATFDVDQTYAPATRADGSANNVNPIVGGEYKDLIWAKTIDAKGNETAVPTARNPNFGRTATRYAPSSARLGFRLTF